MNSDFLFLFLSPSLRTEYAWGCTAHGVSLPLPWCSPKAGAQPAAATHVPKHVPKHVPSRVPIPVGPVWGQQRAAQPAAEFWDRPGWVAAPRSAILSTRNKGRGAAQEGFCNQAAVPGSCAAVIP